MDTLELPPVDTSHYTYRVTWSAEDGEFVATCLEFPSLSWLAESRNAAIDGLEHLVAEVVADMGKTGEQIPEPFAERRFTGTFNIRIGEHLHRNLRRGSRLAYGRRRNPWDSDFRRPAGANTLRGSGERSTESATWKNPRRGGPDHREPEHPQAQQCSRLRRAPP